MNGSVVLEYEAEDWESQEMGLERQTGICAQWLVVFLNLRRIILKADSTTKRDPEQPVRVFTRGGDRRTVQVI